MKKIASLLIAAYQNFSATRPPRCKYYPSCSNYALTAINRYGVKGVAMAFWRLLRCNPWSDGGVDYVDPEIDSADAKNKQHSTQLSRTLDMEGVR
jgi:putative membrane protein insertion efficiency factor